jgi:hypothetical protein
VSKPSIEIEKECAMPAASTQELPEGPNAGMGEERRSAEWGAMRTDYAKLPPHDLTPLLKGMPGALCQCPHWGILYKGKICVRYADHEELVEAGQVFYMAPGHAPEYLEECELVQFSPSAEMNEAIAIMQRNATRCDAPTSPPRAGRMTGASPATTGPTHSAATRRSKSIATGSHLRDMFFKGAWIGVTVDSAEQP